MTFAMILAPNEVVDSYFHMPNSASHYIFTGFLRGHPISIPIAIVVFGMILSQKYPDIVLWRIRDYRISV